MAQVIELNFDSYRWTRRIPARPREQDDEIWPEVSTDYSSANPTQVNPQNAQARVLVEVLLILAVAGMGTVVVILIGPMLLS